MSDQKHIVWYSNKCDYCKEILDLLAKDDISKYMLIDVENEEFPYFVDRVPCIFTNKKEIFVEDKLYNFINNSINIKPFMVNEMGKVSDQYSYIENNDSVEHNFQFLDKEATIITPSDEEGKGSINYEKFLQSRENDLKDVLNVKNSNENKI